MLAVHIAENSDRRERRTVLSCLNGVEVSLGEIIRRSRIQRRRLQPVIESLVEEKAIEKISNEFGVSYKKLLHN